jgi:hypothetical protein
MKGEILERWQQLCQQACVEQDSKRLIGLIREINRLLEEKEQRLRKKRQTSTRVNEC